MSSIEEWLAGLGLGQYAVLFSENDIDFEVLPDLSEQDLEKLGISLGHRKKLLRAVANLSKAEQEAQPSSREALAGVPGGEQRQVTVLFADLSGFTKLSGELGAEETHHLLNRYFDAVDGVVEGYGGTVDKHMGDNVMAVFGAPVAHTNDPERAVRAAFDIHQAVAGVGENVGRPLQVHIGVASGQVVASGTGSDAHREYTVTGDSVNLASRLDELAGPGQTFISDAVHGAVEGFVGCAPVGDVAIKGVDKPIPVWRIVTLQAGRVREPQRPLVGRRAELRQFTSVVEACRKTRGGQTIYVRGEAGIGKSRLVEEFRVIARQQGFACHSGLVLDFGVGKGQDAIRSIVRSMLDIPSGSGKTVRQAAAKKALSVGLLEVDQEVYLNDLLDLAQPIELHAIYDAMDNATRNLGKRETVAELVSRTSASQPIIIDIENIQWADAIVLAHLASLSGAVSECPAVFVMTSRLEGDPLDQSWRSTTRSGPLMTIDLGPLRQDESLELAQDYLEVTSRFAITCVERAEGNPLFLEQLLRSAEETSEDRLPGSVQSIVLARMDSLDAPDKQALQAASVIGQRFSLDVLRHLIESPQYTCATLVEHYLVRPEGHDYLFSHALIRDGVYSSLLKARSRELHRRAAEWFAERDTVLRAEHLDRAEDAMAAQAYLEAAHVHTAEYHYERALQMVERGLDLAKDRKVKFDLICFRGDILRDLGSIDKSIASFRSALDVADNDAQKCQAWIGSVAGMRVSDKYDEALKALDLAETTATKHELSNELARIHYYRGNIYYPLGNIDGCLEQHELSRRYAQRVASPELEARALSGLGDAYYMRGRMITAHDHFNRCVEISREHGFGRIEVANLHMRGATRQYQNDLKAALDDCVGAAEAAAKVGQQRAEMVARRGIGWVLVEMADLTGAKKQFETSLALARRLGARRFEPQNLLHLAKIFALEGLQSEAEKLAEQAYSISSETGSIMFSGPWALGVFSFVTPDTTTRRWALREGEKILSEGCVSHNYFYFYREAMESSLDSGDWESVQRYATALEEYTRSEPLPWSDFYIARGRALAAFGRDERDAAIVQQLQPLRDKARQIGLRIALPKLEAALASS